MKSHQKTLQQASIDKSKFSLQVQANKTLSRRNFLRGFGTIGALTLVTPANFGRASEVFEKRLDLHNIHTGEDFKGVIKVGEEIDPQIQRELSYFLRDHRNGEQIPIDPNLMVLISDLQHFITPQKPFDIVSGYRSRATNEKLRKNSSGVAKNSFHCKGMAVDLKSPKNLHRLRNYAIKLGRGGVGTYSRSGFIHVDVRGHLATWGS